MPTVTKLPVKATLPTTPEGVIRKLNVAAYARVSTDREEQSSSYEAQCDYFTKKIMANPEWEFAGMYADEGITGTDTKHRAGFNQMVEDALNGKIDRIITKSVSRFARNTVDSLTTIRSLKEKGIGVYFEKENIDSLDAKGELLLTIMSSLAQEESRSISENTIWGIRKKMADGVLTMPTKNFLGYDMDENGNLVINPEQAETVKMIYNLFLNGKSGAEIVRILEEKGVKTPGGKDKWHYTTVLSILRNEKYKGDVLLQKTYRVDFLSKKTVVNDGTVQQYYIEDHHEPIIDRDTFALVQTILERRSKYRASGEDAGIFACRVRCAECGGWFGRKVYHSNDSYRKVRYRCNNKYKVKGSVGCHTGLLTKTQIEDAFLTALHKLMDVKDELKANLQEMIEDAGSMEELRKEQNALLDEMQTLADEIQKVVDRMSYGKNIDSLNEEYETKSQIYGAKDMELKAVTERISNYNSHLAALKHFAEILDGDIGKSFNPALFIIMVDYLDVNGDDTINVVFRNGSEILVDRKMEPKTRRNSLKK